jgi:hypothetical protein
MPQEQLQILLTDHRHSDKRLQELLVVDPNTTASLMSSEELKHSDSLLSSHQPRPDVEIAGKPVKLFERHHHLIVLYVQLVLTTNRSRVKLVDSFKQLRVNNHDLFDILAGDQTTKLDICPLAVLTLLLVFFEVLGDLESGAFDSLLFEFGMSLGFLYFLVASLLDFVKVLAKLLAAVAELLTELVSVLRGGSGIDGLWL